MSSFVLFHTLIIDFILTLSKSRTSMNNVMSITCKYFKRITIISDMNTWDASQWINALLDRFDIADWELSKVIISDRNRKFLFALWKALFLRLEIKLLYFIVYHSQFDDSFERINQIIEIALRFMIFTIESENWFILTDSLQRDFNNVVTATGISSNQICYDFERTKSFFIESVEF